MVSGAFSTYQVAEICSVHHTTVINWVKDGRLKAYTTPGGHRRIKKDDLIEFAKKYKIPVADDLLSGRKRLLLVDDDKELLEELKEALGSQGYDVDVAINAFEAGRKIYGSKPDLILLDLKMPGLNGFKMCDILKKDEKTANIPIIAVTGLRKKDFKSRINESGIKYYITKPVNIDLLINTIEKCLKTE